MDTNGRWKFTPQVAILVGSMLLCTGGLVAKLNILESRLEQMNAKVENVMVSKAEIVGMKAESEKEHQYMWMQISESKAKIDKVQYDLEQLRYTIRR